MDKKGYGDGGKGGCAGLALRKPIGHHETNNDIGERSNMLRIERAFFLE